MQGMKTTAQVATESGRTLRELEQKAEDDPVLVVIAHPAQELLGTRFYPYRDGKTVIGRSTENQVFIGDVPSVSRAHAAIQWDVSGLWISDLHSTNGTYVNDRRVVDRVPLRDGDLVQFGVVHMKFLQRPDTELAYHETMYQLASTDGLTNLANRRRFDEELPRELLRSSRYGRPLTLLMIDLDEFKAINDSRGHVAGDALLKHVGQLCRSTIRKEQLVARLGGDELAVICPETSGTQAEILAQRIRDALDQTPLEWEGSRIFVTASIGIAEFDPGKHDAAGLHKAADDALYRAKRAGRNRVCR